MKPGDFFVGIVDFFAVVIPGAMLSFLWLGFAEVDIFNGNVLPQIKTEAEGWVAFILASYLLGQFAFLISATFMDKIYDATYLRYRRRKGDKLYEAAKYLEADNASLSNVLKWAGAYVRLRNAEATVEIDRMEGTSKFFRSLFVVLIVYVIGFVSFANWPAVGGLCILLWLSFWRFAQQRWKFTELCYLYFVELKTEPPEPSTRKRDSYRLE